ncbi:MAG TPA: hypothetical protein VKA14_06130 [Gammaproteobacteria bacterium]|nr:hypothetical protein [Gammaproteobacteria bacterium]
MNLAELLSYIDRHSDYDILAGDADQTLAKSREGAHPDALAGDIVRALAEGCGIDSAATEFERADAVNSLGPLRLQYMKDDAPVEGFRMVEKVIHLIDGAFNEEALRMKGK